MARSFTASPCLLEKGGASRPGGWRRWLRSSPPSPPTTPSPNTPALACPFFMAGKVLIPSAERWARVCSQERGCLQPPAVLGSSGLAGRPCSAVLTLQAHRWPRLWAGPSGGPLLTGQAGGWRLSASVLPALSLPPTLHSGGEVWAEAQGPPALPKGTAPTTAPSEASPWPLARAPRGDPVPEVCWEGRRDPLCLPSWPACH